MVVYFAGRDGLWRGGVRGWDVKGVWGSIRGKVWKMEMGSFGGKDLVG